MSEGWEERFHELSEEYYPGSSQRIPRRSGPPRQQAQPNSGEKEASWADDPSYYDYNGVVYEVFYIRHLARALKRKPVTIRWWEDRGFLPLTLKTKNAKPGMGRRIYSRAQIEGLVNIAHEEGVFNSAHAKLSETRFPEKAIALFKALAPEPLNGATPVKGDL